MSNIKLLTIAAFTLVFTGGVSVIEPVSPQAPATQSLPFSTATDGDYRISQTATCLYNGKRYNKGARLCMGGVYNYCNSRGLWEPSNQTCQ